MDIHKLIQEHLSGKLEINTDELTDADKERLKLKNELLDKILKEVNALKVFVSKLNMMR